MRLCFIDFLPPWFGLAIARVFMARNVQSLILGQQLMHPQMIDKYVEPICKKLMELIRAGRVIYYGSLAL
jgi:hypothetical protein